MLRANYMGNTPVGRTLALLAGFIATSLVAGFIAAGLFMPAADAAGSFARGSAEFFDALPEDFQRQRPSEASIIYAKDGKTPIARFFHENRVLVPLNAIAPVMRHAVVAIEDERFYTHGGLDIQAVSRAAFKNLVSGRTEQGASTITQQYVKMTLLEKAYAAGDEEGMEQAVERSMPRKIREMKYAISVEKQMSKDEILEGYLNVALFGNNVYGVEAASRYFFRTHANRLTIAQAATLAGLVQRPTYFNPLRHPKRALERRNVVLGQMRKLNVIKEDEYRKAVKQGLGLKVTPSRNGCLNANPKDAAFFCEFVRTSLMIDKQFSFLGKTPTQRKNALERGGLRITTTLDPKVQRAAARGVFGAIPAKDPSGVAAAAVTVEPGTGKVLAMAQNRVFDPAGKKGQTTLNYTVDKEHQGSRNGWQPGSTFKPFTLATWLSNGKSLNAVVDAPAKINATPADYSESCQRPGADIYAYHPGNAGDGYKSGSMTVLDASKNSVNTAYIKMSQQLDLCEIARMAGRFGVEQGSPMPIGNGKTTKKIQPLPSMVLGAQNVTPLAMAAAYAGFANGGKYCTPVIVTQIVDHGKELRVPRTTCTQVISREVAAGMSYALSKVISEGTAARAIGTIHRPAAGKTGTTNNSVDTWFVGYTAQLSTAVWVAIPDIKPGEDERRPLRNITINGRPYGTVYGGIIAAPTWKKIMMEATAGMPAVGFDNPPSKMLESEGIPIQDFTGQPVDLVRKVLEQMSFKVEIAPGQVPAAAPVGTVAYTTPGKGSRVPPGATITIHVSGGGGNGVGLPGFGRDRPNNRRGPG